VDITKWLFSTLQPVPPYHQGETGDSLGETAAPVLARRATIDSMRLRERNLTLVEARRRSAGAIGPGEIRRYDRLGGLLHEYYRAAACDATRFMTPFTRHRRGNRGVSPSHQNRRISFVEPLGLALIRL
jgi:hypothetical protein